MKKLIIVASIILFIGLGVFLYFKLSYLYVMVKFDELEPFDKQMNVYFKGFKIGKTIKIYPDKEYKNTYLKLRLHPKHINLPENVTANIKKNKLGGGYVNILYPDSPTINRLKNNAEIQGVITKDINSILNDKLNVETIDTIVDDTTSLIENANNTVRTLGSVFEEVRLTIIDIRPDITKTANNLAKTSKNLENLSANLNESLDRETMGNSIDNIEETTQNIKNITKNLDEITDQINTSSLPVINSSLCHVHTTTKNIDEISTGIKITLKKRMGFGRLLFGRPISDDCE